MKSEPVDPQPGDYDPAVGEFLSDVLHSRRQNAQSGTALQQHYAEAESLLARQTLSMERGADTTWWDYRLTALDDTMTYECDAKLGDPSTVDCSQLEYSQLGIASEFVTIGPATVKFVHSGRY